MSFLQYNTMTIHTKLNIDRQCAQHFENRGSQSGLVGQEMKWSVKFWGSPYGLVGQEMKWFVKKTNFKHFISDVD